MLPIARQILSLALWRKWYVPHRAKTLSGQKSALVVYDAMCRSGKVSLPWVIQQNDPRRRNSSSKLHPSCEPTYDSLHLRYGAAVPLVSLVFVEQ
jgi:hypothetical protein